MKDDLIKDIYFSKSGYGSIASTYKKAHAGLRFITMNDVKNWFYKNVENTAKAKGYNSFINDEAYDTYQMDLIYFGKDDTGQNAALSMIDIFSKWAAVVPIKNKSAENLASAIMECMTKINPKKRPKMMYTDSDTYFIKPWVSEFFKKEGVHLYLTKQSPMVVERFNRTFKNMIWKRIKAGTDKNWRSYVNDVLDVYNNEMASSVTGMTPAEARKPQNTIQTKINLEMHRHSTRKYPTIEVGDYVRHFEKKQTQKKKEHLTNWSVDKFKVVGTSQSFGQTYYKLEGQKREFLRHDLLKVAGP